jgi:hypothetical protein
LGASVIEGTKTQEDRERILDHLGIALGPLPQVLLTGSPNQFLVQGKVDLACGHPFRIPPLARRAQDSVRTSQYVLDTFHDRFVEIADEHAKRMVLHGIFQPQQMEDSAAPDAT